MKSKEKIKKISKILKKRAYFDIRKYTKNKKRLYILEIQVGDKKNILYPVYHLLTKKELKILLKNLF